jgi:outer membrane protein assembly factor BamB
VKVPEVVGSPGTSATRTDWPFFYGIDGRQTGYSPDAGPSEGKLAWRFPKGTPWNARPVIREGKVYVASPGVDVVGMCLDEATGDILWSGCQHGIDLYGTRGSYDDPIVSRDRVLIRGGGRRQFLFDKMSGQRLNPRQHEKEEGDADTQEFAVYRRDGRHIEVVDARTGNRVSSHTADGVLAGDVVRDGDRFYVASEAGVVSAHWIDGGKPVWTRKLKVSLCGTPGLGRGRLYVGTKDGALIALSSADGTTAWTYRTDEKESRARQFYSTAAEANGRVYVGAASACLYCLDAETGSLRWQHRVSDWVRARPLVLGDTVYVATLNARLLALQDKGDTARERWNVPVGEHGFTADLVGNERGILASDRAPILYSVSPETGRLQWRQGILNGRWIEDRFYAADWMGPLQPSPTVVGGVVYIGGGDGFVNALDAETGRERWKFEVRGTTGLAPTVAEGKVFIGQIHPSDLYYALDKDTGEPVWEAKGYLGMWVAPVYAGNRLFLGDMGGHMFSMDPANGKKLWSWFTGEGTDKEHPPRGSRGHGYPPGVYCNPAADDERVYSGSWAGYYFALDQETGKLLWRTRTNNGNPSGGLPDSAAPVLWKNHLVVQKAGHELAALHKDDGRIAWTWEAPDGFLQNGSVAALDDRIFGSVVRQVVEIPYNATVVAFEDVEHGAKEVWRYRGGGGLTGPVVTDDKIIFGSSADMFLTCLDPEDGSLRWRLFIGGQMRENVPALYGNMLFAHGNNGFLFAVR